MRQEGYRASHHEPPATPIERSVTVLILRTSGETVKRWRSRFSSPKAAQREFADERNRLMLQRVAARRTIR
jgi:hypothetical protein